MPRLALYVLIVAVLTSGAVWLANDPGMVSLAWHGWAVETSVGVLVATILLVVFAIYSGMRLVAFVSGKVLAFTARRRERRIKRGLMSLGDGFAAVQAGQADAARRHAKEAATLLSDNSAVLLLRKDAAGLSGDAREAEAAAQALLARPQTELAGLRTLATKALADGDVVGAVGYARRALGRKDAPPWALSVLLDAEIATQRWTDALAALEERVARDVFSPVDLKRLKSRLLALQSAELLSHNDTIGAAHAARKALDLDELNPDAAIALARAMTAQGRGAKAADAIERVWTAKPGPALLAAYRALVPAESTLDWAKRVDALAKAAPDHPESRLAVAEASLEAQLWGQTRNRATALTGEESAPLIRARAAHLLADMEKRQGGDSGKTAEWLYLALRSRKEAEGEPAKPKTVAELLAQAS